jgi:hypothetical protein
VEGSAEEPLCEFEGIFEDLLLEVVVLTMLNTIVNNEETVDKLGEVPMIPKVDGHDKGVGIVDAFLVENPLDHPLLL